MKDCERLTMIETKLKYIERLQYILGALIIAHMGLDAVDVAPLLVGFII
jgi:hypothetical protein